MRHPRLLLLVLLFGPVAAALGVADLSDPKKTVQTLADAIKAGDVKAVKETMVMADDQQAPLLDALTAAIVAQHSMEVAAAAKFGPASKDLVDEGASLEGQIKSVLKRMANMDVVTNGEIATLSLKGPTTAPTTGPATAPAGGVPETENQPDPLHFRKTAGGWKIDAARMMDLDTPGRAKEAEVVTPKLVKIWSEIAANITAGKYDSVDAARNALGEKIASVLAGQ